MFACNVTAFYQALQVVVKFKGIAAAQSQGLSTCIVDAKGRPAIMQHSGTYTSHPVLAIDVMRRSHALMRRE